jgi:hypothetical protein
MSEGKKILIALGVIAALCVCAMGVTYFTFAQLGKKMENIANAEPTSIARVQERVAKFDIPAGYRPIAMSFMGYDSISLIPDTATSGMTIMLMQYGGVMAGNDEQAREQLKQAMEQQNGVQGTSSTVVETLEETIRGETVTVTVSETSLQGVTMRQWVTVFEGNGGPTMLMIQGPANLWDDQLVEDFIASIE